MSDPKVVFIAFAIEDERQRDFLKGQSQLAKCPFEFIDMSVKEAYDTAWKEKVRTRIRRSDGVIALISKDSLKSTGQQWEIACAKEEGSSEHWRPDLAYPHGRSSGSFGAIAPGVSIPARTAKGMNCLTGTRC